MLTGRHVDGLTCQILSLCLYLPVEFSTFNAPKHVGMSTFRIIESFTYVCRSISQPTESLYIQYDNLVELLYSVVKFNTEDFDMGKSRSPAIFLKQ